ncbi:Lipase/esterase family protein [Penicillium ucsense]|uniref:Lipase/esterase family protein n=1 Tax=Penicillium ucsense TaxID=2839758 RepID=A0A8J8WFT8_9EURO|nr:Lipase/esterase family protein [Penicillium ucsense]KAF7736738.1 Lipase/esterase family protein [Penicillium ucsense]
MTLHTVALGAALTPTVLQALIDHYIHRKARHTHPQVHLTYDEGIQIVRQFLYYASKHPVEDLQAFSRQWVPSPHWVRTEAITIPNDFLSRAATTLAHQLGPRGLVRVGGEKWWQWRGPSEELKGEWIEMRNHYTEREKANERCKKIMLYIHGGAYFFGSIDTHRYMLQRHARKLKGRVFAPDYRLAPQFPFPCALQDCLAAYLWLLESYSSKEIILAGDSAGGGMSLSLLVIMRDQGIPLPAGAILISPWVDLTHSFPSIVADNPGDYIPPYGFRHKPSVAWPPPNADELLRIKKLSQKKTVTADELEAAGPTADRDTMETAVRGFTRHDKKNLTDNHAYPGMQQSPNPNDLHAEPDNIRVMLSGETVELKDQIQLYATNQLMSHPLVSPILQPSLGGLPPLQILSGSGEMLRDEQFYLAHKAANPTAYPPADIYLDEFDPNREVLHKYEPTHVQLQVWDDLCHVAPTLSFTRPAKYMFRSISQFGAWALARAQKVDVDIMDHNLLSPTSSSDEDGSVSPKASLDGRQPTFPAGISVGIAGDPLPAFENHMIRQRVDKRGHLYHLDPPSSYPVLAIPPEKVGAINPDLISKWLKAKNEWDIKFAKEKVRVQTRRIKEMAHGFQDFDGECPPPSSLAARRAAPGVLPKRHTKKNYGLALWSGWGSKHDERTMEKVTDAKKTGQKTTSKAVDVGQAGSYSSLPLKTSQQVNSKQDERLGAAKSSFANGAAVVGRNPDTNAENITEGSEDNTIGRPSESTSLRPIPENNAGSFLILPGVDNRKFMEENASTRALFGASGTLPMSSDTSLPYVQDRPSSVGNSVAGQSEFLSELGEDTSIRAVLGVSCLADPIGNADGPHRSGETTSLRTSQLSKDAMPTADDESAPWSSERPDMPDREVFKTAQETL